MFCIREHVFCLLQVHVCCVRLFRKPTTPLLSSRSFRTLLARKDDWQKPLHSPRRHLPSAATHLSPCIYCNVTCCQRLRMTDCARRGLYILWPYLKAAEERARRLDLFFFCQLLILQSLIIAKFNSNVLLDHTGLSNPFTKQIRCSAV